MTQYTPLDAFKYTREKNGNGPNMQLTLVLHNETDGMGCSHSKENLKNKVSYREEKMSYDDTNNMESAHPL